jgi:hypothetical protein
MSLLSELRSLVSARGGAFLSKSVRHADSIVRVRCEAEHVWEAHAHSILDGAWCPICTSRRTRITIQLVRKLARERGGRCLSRTYRPDTKLIWECARGHQWASLASAVKRGKWCRECRRGSIEEMRELARARRGECLSDAYVNRNTHLRWRCAAGHEWEASPGNIKGGTWCPECSPTRRLSIDQMRAIAERLGGRCVSTSRRVWTRTPLTWECGQGHRWKARPVYVLEGRWCPRCAKADSRVHAHQKLQEMARRHRGRCLSPPGTYSRSLRWRCRLGHEFMARTSSVVAGRWCPTCERLAADLARRRALLAEMCALAEARGGECLSSEYTGTQGHLRWRCRSGHTWEARPNNIRRGSWCPVCAPILRGERRRKTAPR